MIWALLKIKERSHTHAHTHHTHTHTHTHTLTHNILTSTVQWMKYFLSLEMHKASLGCSLQILPDVVRDSSETIVRNDAN